MTIVPQTRGQAYKVLRGLLAQIGKTQRHLAWITGLSVSAVEQRMAGKQPWKLPEMYAILDALKQPHERLHEVFPADPYQEVAA